MYNLSFTQQKNPDQYNPVKTIELIPNIYISRLIPSEIDLRSHGHGSLFPLHEVIDNKASRNLPFIFSIGVKNKLLRKTCQVFYFTINTKYEETFKYLGKLPERDKKKTAFLMTLFEANKGSKEAQVQVADMYAEGRGVTRNPREALRYYALSAMQGDLKAQTVVAKCISQGLFIDQDQKIAFDLLKNLADNFEYPEAQYQLAHHLEQGMGCQKDLPEAVRYCMLAAKQDHKKALFALVIYFTDSSYGHINYEKATDLITILIHLNFGKEFTLEQVSHWMNQLGENLPESFMVAVIHLNKQILKHY